MTREINPNVATRDSAYELWMKVPNPMVTLFLSTENNVESVCLLDKKKAKQKDYVEIGVNAEDYYKIKDSE